MGASASPVRPAESGLGEVARESSRQRRPQLAMQVGHRAPPSGHQRNLNAARVVSGSSVNRAPSKARIVIPAERAHDSTTTRT